MTFKIIFPVIITILFQDCKSYPKIEKTELRKIFHDIFLRESKHNRYFLIDSIDKFENKKITESGNSFYIAQNEITKTGVWSKEIDDSAIIISRKYLDSLSNQSRFTEAPSYYWFSMPYFSKDKKSFVIYFNYYCGNLCAESSLRLYQLINGRWVFMKNFFRVVS